MRDCLVYVVDDDPDSSQLIVAALRELRIKRIERFIGPTELLERFDPAHPPFLVITDHRMSPISGTEMLEEIKERAGVVPKALLVTIHREAEFQDFSGEFLQKPFKDNDFIDAIKARVLKLLQ